MEAMAQRRFSQYRAPVDVAGVPWGGPQGGQEQILEEGIMERAGGEQDEATQKGGWRRHSRPPGKHGRQDYLPPVVWPNTQNRSLGQG